MSNRLFQRYRELASKAGVSKNTRSSLEWFRNRIRKDSPIRNLDKVTEGLRNSRIEPGEMITYEYDPKTKDKLPFYDLFPLIIVLGPAEKGWYGVNLHYLPPAMRAELLIQLRYRKNSLESIAKGLENNPYTKAALKRYLANHVRSRPKKIPKDEWEIAIALPTENFQKANNKTVWQNSKRKI